MKRHSITRYPERDKKLSAKGIVLHNAVKEGKSNDVNTLLKYMNIDPNIQDSAGETALHIAAENCDIETAEILLKYDANPNLGNLRGNTALHIAAEMCNLKMIKIMIKSGAKSLSKNDTGITALDVIDTHIIINKLDSDRARKLKEIKTVLLENNDNFLMKEISLSEALLMDPKKILYFPSCDQDNDYVSEKEAEIRVPIGEYNIT